MKACSLIDRLQRDQWLARGNWEKPMESTPLVAGSQVVVTGLSGGALELRKVYNNAGMAVRKRQPSFHQSRHWKQTREETGFKQATKHEEHCSVSFLFTLIKKLSLWDL